MDFGGGRAYRVTQGSTGSSIYSLVLRCLAFRSEWHLFKDRLEMLRYLLSFSRSFFSFFPSSPDIHSHARTAIDDTYLASPFHLIFRWGRGFPQAFSNSLLLLLSPAADYLLLFSTSLNNRGPSTPSFIHSKLDDIDLTSI